ncbi:hypothetical protein C5167_041206 [Papaver somniferum]|uniref:Uncharacterized protein n=1 Tax=Papaver somniferum TaxID=3469 RepID=A0A4Y7IL99_PAPSO|nr:hypothetical protein C5167_041206 [Papaver somniferum]
MLTDTQGLDLKHDEPPRRMSMVDHRHQVIPKACSASTMIPGKQKKASQATIEAYTAKWVD